MNTIELVVEIRPEKNQARTDLEPMTSAIPVQRSATGAARDENKHRLRMR